ncbi:sugar/nucleoside kinase (ribokinase family) [Kibdelosporangium banguiense]|uniref:Sugar/nucleoside kinase (Ribokinase family) n=1 Tax=Kibdelosporangium banguiense TaxID=1365924 RepID=A0ABS4T7U3_9PSEU|nr:PfkB family carbohydrate kinase [Kibdelosporangium banguiense]MBP2320004.1 sugar/nucleoside kinase (ribokinase family) [Kibdelosporangium banguiense]
MTRVVVAGVVNIRSALAVERFPVSFVSSRRQPEAISVQLSGSGFGVARTLKNLGTDVSFATYVGMDSLGLLAVSGLREAGMYGPGVLVAGTQPRSVVLYDKQGTRANTTDLRTVPSLRYPPEIFEGLLAGGCDLAVLTNIGFTRPLISSVVDRGIPVATDLHVVADMAKPHNQDWMRVAHILACSHEELPVPPEQWVRMLHSAYGTELCLVGCGPAGAVLGVRGSVWRVRAVTPRGVRYTSGAGDTLLGSFVHHYLSLGDPVAAVRHAVLTAGWKVGRSPDDPDDLSSAVIAGLVEGHGLPEISRLR